MANNRSQQFNTILKRISLGLVVIGLVCLIAYLDYKILPVAMSAAVLVLLGAFAWYELFAMAKRQLRQPTGSGPIILLGMFVIVLPLAALLYVRMDSALGGLSGLLFLIGLTKIGDIFAYFGGTFLGKHPMAPRISPKKTWEGAALGFLAAILFAYILAKQDLAAGLSPRQAVLLAVLINPIAQLSDLLESKIKRFYAVKDSATYLSVMGGVLDMIDSFILAAPAYVIFRILLINYA